MPLGLAVPSVAHCSDKVRDVASTNSSTNDATEGEVVASMPVTQPTGHRLRPMEGGDRPGPRIGVEAVGEHVLVTGRLVEEREWVDERREV